MTLIDISPRARSLTNRERQRIEAVVSQYGVLHVLRATLIVAIRKKRTRVARAFDRTLPDYIRRDIGLPPRADPPCHHKHLY